MKEKTVFITGANKGIGFGIAKHLGLSGWQVIIGARDEARAEKAIAELRSLGIDVPGWVNIELSDLCSIEKAAKEIKERFGQVNPFRVPDGYFDHLADQVMASLPEQPVQQAASEKPKAKRIGIRSLYYYAAAAVCALVVSIAVWQSFPQTSEQAAVPAQMASADQPGDAAFDEAADYVMLDNSDIYACLTDNY